MYEVIIIGAGPAGLTAAIFAARKNLNTLVLSQNIGGQSLLTHKIENYPGIKSVRGRDLATVAFEQARGFGVEIKQGVVIERLAKKESGFEVIDAEGKKYFSTALIVASGKKPMSLGIPGEKKLSNKGVSYCSTSDAKTFKGKDVVVIGGGNAGLGAALDFLPFANKIYILEFASKITGDESIFSRLRESSKVTFITDAKAQEIYGEKWVEGISYLNRKINKAYLISCFGVSINVGQTCSTGFLGNFVKLNEKKEIEIDSENKTFVEGVFACGDATSVPYKQWVIAAGEGAKAALSAYAYVAKVS